MSEHALALMYVFDEFVGLCASFFMNVVLYSFAAA